MLVGRMALEIRLLAKRGKGLRAIAREVGVSRNTVRRYLRDGDAERYRPRPRRPGKLAAFLMTTLPSDLRRRRPTGLLGRYCCESFESAAILAATPSSRII